MSPLTVATTTVPLSKLSLAGIISLMVLKAACIVSAASITCGKNNLPEPNLSPTTFIASDKPFFVISNGSMPSAKAFLTSSTMASFSPCSTQARIFANGSLLSKDFFSGPFGAELPGALDSSS